MIEELNIRYGGTEEWKRQVALASVNPILYLHEYQFAPGEIAGWKNDDDLEPPFGKDRLKKYRREYTPLRFPVPKRLCVGIGAYKTEHDGELYMCAILDRDKGTVLSYSIGVYRSPELVSKALELFFDLYKTEGNNNPTSCVSLLSSRNSLYRTALYGEVISRFPVVQEMTQKGVRGGVSAVSTLYSQLMRQKGSTVFSYWQDGIDWLGLHLMMYNLKRSEKN